ncbi:acyl-homoserine-lactone synthase [Aeromonas schubertii]|uniref:acyl-homoserine-lactone synthase n=1 Tax=Aeromonas schubertii TaxID=652 RepID=UPI0010A76171|nr:acyl-homoserine-lactone synthase [Aeromonas schubertii]QCG46797.1 GNAT family N-acetyltransferase [Aeromonas schubertii]
MFIYKGKTSQHPNRSLIRQLYQFRKSVFSDRLGWDVEHHQGLEQDRYDGPDTHWVLVEDEQGLCGCIRMLPTEGPYMLPEIFPTALAGEQPPRQSNVWELTRLAIDAERAPRLNNGVSELTLVIFRGVYEFARQQGIDEMLAVVSLPVERIFRRMGLPVERMGDGKPVDLGAVNGVGIRFIMDERFARAVGIPLQGNYERRMHLPLIESPQPRQPHLSMAS